MMQKNNLWRYSLFLAFLTTLSFSCRSSPTGTHITEKVQLSAEYVTCTEVWLKVGFTDSPNGGNFAINRDGNIQDVWAMPNTTSGQGGVMAVASDQFTNNGVAVLQLSGTQVNMLQTAGLPTTSIVGIYSANGREWYVCGDGLYKTRALVMSVTLCKN